MKKLIILILLFGLISSCQTVEKTELVVFDYNQFPKFDILCNSIEILDSFERKISEPFIGYTLEPNPSDRITNWINENFKAIEKVLNKSYKELYTAKAEDEFIEMIYKGLLSLLFSHIYQSGREINDILGDREYVIEKTKEKDLNRQLKTLLEFYKKTIEFSKRFENTRSYKLVNGAKKYIKENYHRQDLTVKDVSKSQYINETYMRSLFKKEAGMTVNEYLTKVRLDKTKEILKSTEYRLSDIAEMVGYNDSSYLSKIFKKNIGISPSKYR